MKNILLYLVQVFIVSGILYGYYHLFLRNSKFHQYNRFYLLAIVFISILIPFLQIPVYFSEESAVPNVVIKTWQTFTPVPELLNDPGNVVPAVAKTSLINLDNAVFAIYWLVATIIFMQLVISVVRILRLKRRNPNEDMNGIKIIATTDDAAPFSFFSWMFWHRRIEISSHDGQQIFRHELFHIQQKHSIDLIFIEIVSMIFWVNPFFHLIRHELKTIHEFLADKFATTEDTKWEYSELLLMQVLNTRYHLVNPFFHNQIKRRIAMITKTHKTSYQYLRKLLVLPLSVIVIVLFAFRFREKDDVPGIKLKASVELNDDKPGQQEIATQLLAEASQYQIAPGALNSTNSATSDTSKEFFNENWGFELTVEEVVVANPGYSADTKNQVPDLVIFNGEEYSAKDFKSKMSYVKAIKAKKLYAIPPGNSNAIETYGERARNGVIEIEDATIEMKVNLTDIQIRSGVTDEQPLIVLDGKIVTGGINSLKYLEPGTIESINVLKNENATNKYGEKGKFGVIEINLKQEEKLEVKSDIKVDDTQLQLSNTTTSETKIENTVQVTDEQIKVFEKMEVEPSYPGGTAAWNKYLENNLDKNIGKKNSAPKGQYTVITRFVVHDDGHISDIRPLTNHGYGMENEALRVIENASKWIPGIQNGRKVNGVKKLPINFIVSSGSTAQNFILPEIIAVGYIAGKINPESLKTAINTPPPGIRIGSVEWKKYFERNLNSNIPISEGWKPGDFRMVVQFTRNTDGSVSNVKVLNYRGSKTAAHCLEIFKTIQSTLSPEANAQSNIYQQPIIFSLIEDKKVVSFSDKKIVAPLISKKEFPKTTPYQLFKPAEGTVITGFKIGAEDAAGDYHECSVTGDKYNATALKIIANAPTGSNLFFESVTGLQNGPMVKLPSRVYKVN